MARKKVVRELQQPIVETPQETEKLIPVAPSEIQDRMLMYRNPRHIHCPECDAHPVVCMSRRGNLAFMRCRICQHRWEVGF